MSKLTQPFDRVNAGDRGAIDRLMGVMYQELHALAHRRPSASARFNSLETTGLLHESSCRASMSGEVT